MVIDSISPTFSIPSTSTFFEISTDNGITYTDANVIEIDYYALNKMTGFTGDINPLNLLFRKKSNIIDERDYRITKILVNTASTFLPSPNTGLNVISTSTQEAQGNYLAGRYATYDSVTTGGLNFSDFKIQSIENTSMQMVFFVSPVGGLNITINSYSASNNSTSLKVYLNKTGNTTSITKNIKNNSVLTFSVHCSFSYPSDLVDKTEEYFEYGVTKADVLGVTQLPANPTQTGAYEWNIDVNEVVWTADPIIEIRPIKFSIKGKRPTDEYEVTISGLAKFNLNSAGHWVWTGESLSGTFVAIEHTAIYEETGKPEEQWQQKTCWRVKSSHGGSTYNYGFEKGSGTAVRYYKPYSASYNINNS